MSKDHNTVQDWRGTRRSDAIEAQPEGTAGAASEHEVGSLLPSSLFHDGKLQGRGNALVRHDLTRQMQQRHGNRAVQRCVQRRAVTSVQRTAFDGNNADLKDDFWGFKKHLGQRWGGAADAWSSRFWNMAGVIPPIGAAGTMIDVGKWAFAEGRGDADAAARFRNDAIFSAIGMHPAAKLLGPVTGTWDTGAAAGRSLGYDVPTSGDLWDLGVKGLGGIIDPASAPPGANDGGHGGGPQSTPEDADRPVPVPIPVDNDGGHGGGPQNYLSAYPLGGGMDLPGIGPGVLPNLKDMGIGSPLIPDLGSFF